MNSGKYKNSSFLKLLWFDSECFDLVKTISNSFVQIIEIITIIFNTNICANQEKWNLKLCCTNNDNIH